MKRTLKLTFQNEADWATVLEAMRRRPERSDTKATFMPYIAAVDSAVKIAAICRDYLDRPSQPQGPATPQSGEGKP